MNCTINSGRETFVERANSAAGLTVVDRFRFVLDIDVVLVGSAGDVTRGKVMAGQRTAAADDDEEEEQKMKNETLLQHVDHRGPCSIETVDLHENFYFII